MILSHFWAQKSKMAAKIQDGGRKFFILLTKKLDMVLKNSHTKNGAWCRSVTGQSLSDSTSMVGTRLCANSILDILHFSELNLLEKLFL